MNRYPIPDIERRRFLKGAAAASAGALVMLSAREAVSANAPPKEDLADGPSRGYHETAHIRAYYETLRL